MSFKNYLDDLEKEKSVVYTFGRMNPMTKGHQALWDFISKEARKYKADGIIYTSFSQNTRKNPLNPKDKIMYIQKVLKKGARISQDQSIKNAFTALEDLIKKGYTSIKFVVGADRKHDFNDLKKYCKQWSNGEARIDIISFSGDSRIGDYSGTKMRQLAKENNFKAFREDLPSGLTLKDAQEIFDKTRIGLGV